MGQRSKQASGEKTRKAELSHEVEISEEMARFPERESVAKRHGGRLATDSEILLTLKKPEQHKKHTGEFIWLNGDGITKLREFNRINDNGGIDQGGDGILTEQSYLKLRKLERAYASLPARMGKRPLVAMPDEDYDGPRLRISTGVGADDTARVPFVKIDGVLPEIEETLLATKRERSEIIIPAAITVSVYRASTSSIQSSSAATTSAPLPIVKVKTYLERR